MKNLHFGTKLLLILVSITFIALSVMILFISNSTHKSLEGEAIKYVNEFTRKSGLEVKSILDKAVVVTNSMTNKYENAIKYKEELNEMGTIEYLKNMLDMNPFLVGIWYSFEDGNILYNSYDGTYDRKYYTTNKAYFEPYVTRNKDGSFSAEGSGEFDTTKPWIKRAIETKTLSATVPYIDDSTNALMLTVSKPIIIEGKVVGVVGVDISLDFLQENISKIKLYETGYSALYDYNGYVVGHLNPDLVGKQIKDLTKNNLILNAFEKASKGEEAVYSTVNFLGKDSYNYVYPIELGNSGEYWALFGIVAIEEYLETANDVRNFAIISGIVVLLLICIIIIFSMRKLDANLTAINDGLLGFFKFLNKESNDTNKIELKSNDEFGTMANAINQNIEKTKALIVEDNILIEDVKRVVAEVKAGHLDSKIVKVTNNESLEELKNNFNDMLEITKSNVCSDINKVLEVLNNFSKLDFRLKIENDNGRVATGINDLAQIITNMLIENKTNGLTLENSSQILLKNVDQLNLSSNEAAASLEETAAALEEITSNIRNNTDSISQMAKLSNGVTQASQNGEKLANQTTVAMEEINTQVNLVNEAISIIDQIAFQTNILSLNAAVEAATAGEAGKGFAVVAQEVRNLASRSAEAANDIKRIVEQATQKANEGKDIALNMIEGFKDLSSNISQTMNLIDDIQNASKEQLMGIEQINDAVNQLDQQTQQNAAIATQAHDIALGTDEIARMIVEDVDAKEFNGKDSVAARNSSTNIKTQNFEIRSEKKINTKINTTTQKPIQSKNIVDKSDDEWESF